MLEESEAIIRRNKENATKKKYHHHLGSGGYCRSLSIKYNQQINKEKDPNATNTQT